MTTPDFPHHTNTPKWIQIPSGSKNTKAWVYPPQKTVRNTRVKISGSQPYRKIQQALRVAIQNNPKLYNKCHSAKNRTAIYNSQGIFRLTAVQI